MASYIPDGWTRDGYIAAAQPADSGECLYDALTFTYRPATRMENVKLDAAVRIEGDKSFNNPENAVKAEMLACKFIADHVVSWDLKAVGIHDVPVTADSCSRLQSELFNILYLIIRGSRCNDKKPDATESPKSDAELQKN